jgi:hypothetical protein
MTDAASSSARAGLWWRRASAAENLHAIAPLMRGGIMSISWQHDLDEALGAARSAKRPVLLDFSAAPM